MKKISLEQLLKDSGTESYPEQYRYICAGMESGNIIPVKSSPLNGKKPALHISYWLSEEAPDHTEEIEELQFRTMPVIRTDYYLSHPEIYREERKWVRLLNRFFCDRSGEDMGTLPYVSLNERSFQIWGREKFLQREQGRKILAHCGVGLEQLHVYRTTEPLAYYSHTRQVPQTILILENKDTFYTMRRWLMGEGGPEGTLPCAAGTGENDSEAFPRKIFGAEIGTLIYGAGKGILRSSEDFRFCVEPHINHPDNEILYFGDLDYEGIGIYERLAGLFAEEEEKGHTIKPFIPAYEKMIEKANDYGIDFLPQMSEKQNHHLSGRFFGYFSRRAKEDMNRFLEENRYIPQEIVTITDYETPAGAGKGCKHAI